MISSEQEDRPAGPGGAGTGPESPCPAPSRFWEVALGGSWAPAERHHVSSCPRCQASERAIGSAVAGRVAEPSGPVPSSGPGRDVQPGIDPPTESFAELGLTRALRNPQSGGATSTRPGAFLEACGRFESAWVSGTSPWIESYLAEVQASERPALLRELVALELELRRRRGERPEPWEYLERFPGHAGLIDAACLGVEPRSGGTLPAGTFADPEATAQHPPHTIAGKADEEDLSSRGWSEPPRRLGNYEVIEKVGSGGMGAVYKVYDHALGRVAALKIAHHLGPPDSQVIDRFFRAARLAARLVHPSIVPIFEVDQIHGMPYIVSQFIEGEDLSTLLRRAGRLPARHAAGVIAETADALQFAHDHGVIHRDIKPSNIMIRPDGHAVLTDFGLARPFAIDEEASLTATGELLGTPAYMSPEQASAGLAAMGPASDIYSLGATLYAVLVGRPPLRGQSVMETLRQTVDVEPEPPRRLDRSVPRDLELICLKALSKRPGERYESALSMAADLRRFLEGHPIQARPEGATGRVARWLRRRPARAIACLLAVAAVALIVLQRVELQGARDGRVLRRTISRSQEAELWKAVEDGESRARAHPEDREGRRALASTYHRLGDLLVNTDRLAEATWAYGRAVEALRQRVREEPGASAPRVELAVVLESQGEASWAIGRPHEAREAYRDALTLRRELAVDHPRVPAYRDDLARTLRRLNQFEGDADRRPGT